MPNDEDNEVNFFLSLFNNTPIKDELIKNIKYFREGFMYAYRIFKKDYGLQNQKQDTRIGSIGHIQTNLKLVLDYINIADSIFKGKKNEDFSVGVKKIGMASAELILVLELLVTSPNLKLEDEKLYLSAKKIIFDELIKIKTLYKSLGLDLSNSRSYIIKKFKKISKTTILDDNHKRLLAEIASFLTSKS